MTFLYFAYGSNMLSTRLQRRCPNATIVGTAIAEEYELHFSKPSKDGSGKGALVKRVSSNTEGVLFKIPKSELKGLDDAEGKGYGYERDDKFSVRTNNGGMLEVVSYIQTKTDKKLQPYDWYLALVLAGAHKNGFAQEYMDKLRSVPYKNDTKETRTAEAIKVLKEAGYPEWRSLLGI